MHKRTSTSRSGATRPAAASGAWASKPWRAGAILIGLCATAVAASSSVRCSPVTCLDPDVAAAPPVSQDEVELAWEARFGPLPRTCNNVVVGWMLLDDAAYESRCPPASSACISNNDCPVAVARKRCDASVQRLLYAHELAHWFSFCSRGNSDHNHADAELWSSDGFVKSFAPEAPQSCVPAD